MPNDPITEVNSAMDDCVAAQEAGDYQTALRRARTAWMRIMQIPDSEFDEEKLTWNREGIRQIVAHLTPLAQGQGAAASSTSGGATGALIHSAEIGYQRG
jgi:hypothetical protein